MYKFIATTSCLVLFVLAFYFSACHSKDADTTLNNDHSYQLMGDGVGIISATVVVKNIDSAIKYYNDVLGFHMTAGDTTNTPFYEGTRSTFTSFPDWFNLELLGIKDSARVAEKNSFITSFLQHHEGAGMYMLSTSSADSTYKWLRSQGFTTDTILYGRNSKKPVKGWQWDDGNAQWRDVAFKQKAATLPDFFEYVGTPLKEYKDNWRPYAFRKWYDSLNNGAVALSYLKLIVKNIDSARNIFQKMGLPELESTDSSARFKVAHDHYLQLVQPTASQNEERNFLQTRGEGIFAIGFEVKKLSDTYAFFQKKLDKKGLVMDSAAKKISVLKEYALGVQLDFMQESKEKTDLAAVYNFKDDKKLDSVTISYASAMYQKYCGLCHGKNREGYAADNAPSLKSEELWSVTQKPRSAYNYIEHTISYGRTGTAMAPYSKDQGGPLNFSEIELLIRWLYEESGVKKPIELKTTPVVGKVETGKAIYHQHCAVCHGEKGEGIKGPALANPMFLATASDAFIQYTITHGRSNTPMPSFRDSLKKTEIDAVTAFLRSRATGWNAPPPVTVKEPDPKDYVLHPGNKPPVFSLKEGKYVPAEQVLKAIRDSARMIILDARSKAAWNQTHIPGAVPVPYYDDPDTFIKNIPNDDTWIIVYCACPHAASDKVVSTLRRFKYKNTAIIDEGILVWAQRGYPVQYGQDTRTGKGK